MLSCLDNTWIEKDIDKSTDTDYTYTVCVRTLVFNWRCQNLNIRNYIELIEQQRKEQDSIYHNVAVQYGLSDTAMWALYNIYMAEDSITQQELCHQCFLSKQTVNTAITGLTKMGYVELENMEGRRNYKRILLTEKGVRLADATIKPLMKAEEKAYAILDDAEIKAYLDITTKLTASLRKETEKLEGERA